MVQKVLVVPGTLESHLDWLANRPGVSVIRPTRAPTLGEIDRFIENVCPMLPLLHPTNRQRATIQAPQGLDGKHDGELFPIDESKLTVYPAGLDLAG
jgi:hypothetical protein